MLERSWWFRATLVVVVLSAFIYLAGAVGRLWGFVGDLILIFFLAWLVGSVLIHMVNNLMRIPGMRRPLAILVVYLGLILERGGDERSARAHFERAIRESSGEFAPAVPMSTVEFRAEIDGVISGLPEEFRVMLKEVSIELAETPAREDLLAVEPPFAPTILGLFRGLPKGVTGDPSTTPPRAIVLYTRNLARAVRTRAELKRQVRRTLLHEIGHLAGLDEDELRRRGLD